MIITTAISAVDATIPGYVIHQALGQGGMATVFLATQEKLKRQVALKVILPHYAADPEFRERFISEGQLTARLYHRHIMTVFDIGEASGRYYIASELLPGGTLAERLPEIRSVVDKLLIVREVAQGLGFAHANHVVHRDVKPGNILFRADGTAVVADFGIAKTLDVSRAQTLQGMVVGTPSYMSPEQVQGKTLDGRSDLYSLGVMLFQMLSGALPFNESDVLAVAMAHIAKRPPPLPARFAPLQPLVGKLLEKDPDKRFADSDALCAAIDELIPTLDDAALSDGAVSTRRPPSKTGPRRSGMDSLFTGKRTAVVFGVVMSAVLLTAIGIRWQQSSAPGGVASPQPAALPTAALGADAAWLELAKLVRERIAQRLYFAPAGGSAHDALTTMLSERPTDIDALELAQELCRAVADDALRLIKAGDRTQAGLLISQAKARFPSDPAIASADALLRGEVAQATPSESTDVVDVDELRTLARRALSEQRINSPAGDNAVMHFRAILRQSPDDREAADALRRIAADQVIAAQAWLDRGNLGQANTAILRGLEAVPGDPELMRLRSVVSEAAGN